MSRYHLFLLSPWKEEIAWGMINPASLAFMYSETILSLKVRRQVWLLFGKSLAGKRWTSWSKDKSFRQRSLPWSQLSLGCQHSFQQQNHYHLQKWPETNNFQTWIRETRWKAHLSFYWWCLHGRVSCPLEPVSILALPIKRSYGKFL